MRVSMLSTLPPIKGVSPYTLNLVKGISRINGVDFWGFDHIYPEFLYPGDTKTGEKTPEIKNVAIHNVLNWYDPFSWIKVGLRIDTGILHAQWWSWMLSPVYLCVLGLAKIRGKRVILTVHNVKPHEKSPIYGFLNALVIGMADEYIVHSDNNRQLLIKRVKKGKNVHVIPHGIICMERSARPVAELKKKYGFGARDRLLLFFGNIRDYKGLDVLLEALSRINDRSVKLIIAGRPWKSFAKYNRLIDELGITERVYRFLDFNSEEKVSELFKISDLAVYPYREFESSSGALSIALCFSKPIVVTDVGGLPECVRDQRAIAKPGDAGSLSRCIKYALKNAARLSKDSKKMADKFNWKKISSLTCKVYSQ